MRMDEVGVDRKNDNEVDIIVDGVNDDDKDVKDVDKSIAMDDVNEDGKNATFEGNKNGMNKNVVKEVRIHSHRLHLSSP